jgi:hypothetical protein
VFGFKWFVLNIGILDLDIVCNLEFEIWNLFVIWCLRFGILVSVVVIGNKMKSNPRFAFYNLHFLEGVVFIDKKSVLGGVFKIAGSKNICSLH